MSICGCARMSCTSTCIIASWFKVFPDVASRAACRSSLTISFLLECVGIFESRICTHIRAKDALMTAS